MNFNRQARVIVLGLLLLLASCGGSSPSTKTGSTTPPSDTTAPTAPANLTAAAISIVQINLTWGASTDDVGVTGYLVERCQGAGCANFAQIATPTAASFNDTGLTSAISVRNRRRARRM